MQIEKDVQWYKQERPKFEIFTKKMADWIQDILNEEKIIYHRVEYRTKEIESFKEKISESTFYEPKEMQNLCGVRIIAYI